MGTKIKSGLGALLLGALAACTSPAEPGTPLDGRPNILVIVTDDQRVSGLRVMPELRRWFGQGGVRFSNAFATTPTCCPSRASIFTGRYAHNHGVQTNAGAEDLDHSTTIQHDLQQAGYTTGLFGKFLNLWDIERDPPHFDHWVLIRDDYPAIYYDFDVSEDGEIRHLDDVYSTDYLAGEAVEFLNERESELDAEPWAMFVTPFAPHSPFDVEASHRGAEIPEWELDPSLREDDVSDKPPFVQDKGITPRQWIRKKQLRSLMSVDELIGKLAAGLEYLGEDNTLAVFVSDNGYMWGEHGLGSKRWPYTPSIKVPMFVRWPGHFEAGTTDKRLVANIDIVPTIRQAVAGLPALRTPVDGRSLLADGERERLLLEYFFHRFGAPDWASIRTKRAQYIEYYEKGRRIFREYYDLKADPWQLQNLLAPGRGEPVEGLRRIKDQLARDRDCAGSACP